MLFKHRLLERLLCSNGNANRTRNNTGVDIPLCGKQSCYIPSACTSRYITLCIAHPICQTLCPTTECSSECPPYVVQEAVCPAVTGGALGVCMELCTHDTNCSDGKKCCSDGCGHHCMDSVSLPHYQWQSRCQEPCTSLLAQLQFPPGAYVPQCQDNGDFSPQQLWGSTGLSWCVDTLTGKPSSEAFPRSQLAECHETGNYSGITLCSVHANTV